MPPRFAALLPVFALALTISANAAAFRHRFDDSIKEVPIGAPVSGPHRVRGALTPNESAQSIGLVVSLRLRNLPELESIVGSGRTVPLAEMEARYLPLRSDYDRVAAWLAVQGLTPIASDSRHTNISVRGTVAAISAALGVTFARVATTDGEFTSAVTAPFLPDELAPAVIGISGLQPHIRLRHRRLQTNGLSPQFAHPGAAVPSDILAAYHVPANLNGAGQTIGISSFAIPLPDDLIAFAQLTGSSASPANVSVVVIGAGPTVQNSEYSDEAALDVEWAAGTAPGANIRIYAMPDEIVYLFVSVDAVLSDGIVTVFSTSIEAFESDFPASTVQSLSQGYLQMAAAGITVLGCTLDTGAFGIQPGSLVPYPASDPSVTSVGGTVMDFDANWNDTGETAWSFSGGGYSMVFPQPSWQTGPGLSAGAMRSLPDIAAVAGTLLGSDKSGVLLVENGFVITGGGTSLATPVWGGLVAIINQARAQAGLPSIGLLGPHIYPLIGTSAFTAITQGNNGYPAGPGYNLCTGIGTPNLGVLIQALTAAPSISIQPSSQSVTPGSTVVFAVTAPGPPAPTYQWQLNGAPIVGATNSRLVLSGAATTAGSYSCVVSNANGQVTSGVATLTVTPTANPGRLVNLSMLSDITSSLSMGFVIGGTGTSGNENLLIRAVGPSIGPGTLFNVGNVMVDPILTVVQQTNNAISFRNAGWGSNQASVMAADNATGAFGLTVATSMDSALVQSLPSVGGGYSATVAGSSGDGGYALTEVYDDTSNYTAASTRLLNLSCLTNIPVGGTIDVGFVIGGTTAKTLFIRASGPTLAVAPFGVGGTMADPQVTVVPSAPGSAVISANAGWGGDPVLSSVAAGVGAFAFASTTSLDSATVVTLEPDVPYAVQVNSANGGGGEVLVEIYEVP